MNLVQHLERELGKIDEGWSVDANGKEAPFQVARFRNGSIRDAVAFSTVGLGRFPFHWKGGHIRIELLIIVREQLADSPIPNVLQWTGAKVLSSGIPLLRGEVVKLPSAPFVDSAMTSVYSAVPVYFPDSFAVCKEDSVDVAIAWLIPISENEANYVSRHGWSKFEEKLASEDPDLLDVYRPELRALEV